MRKLLIPLAAMFVAGTTFVACKSSNNNSTPGAASPSETGPQAKPILVTETDALLNGKIIKIVKKAMKSQLQADIKSVAKKEAWAKVTLKATVPLAPGEFAVLNYSAEMNAESGMYHISKPIDLAGKKTVQVAFLCGMRGDVASTKNTCNKMFARIYLQNSQYVFEHYQTIYRYYSDGGMTTLSPEDIEDSLMATAARNGSKTFNDFYKIESKWSIPRIDLTTSNGISSQYKDALGNPLRAITDTLYISIPISYINYPEDFMEYHLRNFIQDNYVGIAAIQTTQYNSTTVGTNFSKPHYHKGRLADKESGQTYKDGDLMYKHPVEASGLRRYSGKGGLEYSVLCVEDGCTRIHVIVSEYITDPDRKRKPIGAFEFIQDKKDPAHWNLTVFSRKAGLTFDDLAEEFQSIIAVGYDGEE